MTKIKINVFQPVDPKILFVQLFLDNIQSHLEK